MHRSSLVIVMVLCTVLKAFGQYSYDGSSSEAATLQRLYSAAGLVFPTISFPIFREDISRYADALINALPAGPLRESALSFAAPFMDRKGIIVTSRSNATYQPFIGFPEGPIAFGELLTMEEPFVEFSLGLQLDNSIQLVITHMVHKKYSEGLSINNIPTLLPGPSLIRENNSIQEGYLRFLAGPIDVVFGRQPLHLGPSEDTSIAISTQIPFMDALKIRLFAGPLTMTWLISTLENRCAEGDPDLGSIPGYDYGDTIILYNIHYFEWAFRRVRVGIGAHYLVSRPYNAFQFGDFFPVFSWHNADIAPNNMVLMGDVTWAPFPGVSLYLQVGFDDINLNTLGTADSGIPTIDAEIAGVSYSVGVEPAWSLALSAEGGHTHYLWGNFSYGTPLDSYLERAIYRMNLWSTVQAAPLTSPYGPGSWWLSAKARLSAPWGGTASINASYVLKNPLADLQTTPYAVSELIENASLERHLNISLDLEYRLGKIFRAAFSPEIRFSPSSIWLSLALGVSITFNSAAPATSGDAGAAP